MTDKICSAADAVTSIKSGQAVASTGVIGWSTPDALLAALGNRFELTGSPNDLTFLFPVGTGDAMGIPGMDHVARVGLMKRIVSGSYINPRNPLTGLRPKLMELVKSNAIEAYSWPIGATMHWLREVARGGPGYLTRIGLGTYIDPRQQGGKFTGRATQDLVEVVNLRDEQFLFYPSWPLDVAFVRASASDDLGNLSFERDPLVSSAVSMAMAVKASGGTVIAQVGELVPRGSRPAHAVRVPGELVDRVVVVPDQVMTTDVAFDAAYLGFDATALTRIPQLPAGADKVVARRVAREIRPREMSIFGFGASSDAVLTMVEDGLLDGERLHEYSFTTEHGSFGGIVMSGWQFSANISPIALLDGPSQFDFIDGGGCTFAALSFAEFDAVGNVNVSKFGSANPGAGGFIDIAHNAKRLVFAGTLTTAGLSVLATDGKLEIKQEGSIRKFVERVEQVTYSVADGVARGQQARIITERAVFDITRRGLDLVEVAPGIDPVRDVAAQMSFPIHIPNTIPLMDESLFTP
ncbi:CoA-transferase [Dactylosporangium sp. CA-233914]|uniref:CoA-transferase n=1 Tax=Dactylosporangium sp. CA-233914 TaxID=3239934 RepID=UPI003D8B9C78